MNISKLKPTTKMACRLFTRSIRKSSTYVSGVHTKELGGKQLIMDPSTNQGMAFDLETRQMLGMHGLLPPRRMDQEEQLELCWNAFNKLKTPIEKYGWMSDLCNRNEKLFYAMLKSDIKTLLPIGLGFEQTKVGK